MYTSCIHYVYISNNKNMHSIKKIKKQPELVIKKRQSLQVSVETHEEITRMAKASGLTIDGLLQAMIKRLKELG